MELIKVYDTHDYLNNVITPLSIGVDKVIFVTHDKILFKQREAMIALLREHDIEVLFFELKEDERDVNRLLEYYKDAILDISSNRYLNFYLFERAIAQDRAILYYDNRENVIKDYRAHRVYTDKLYRLTIEEMIELAGGILNPSMHEAPNISDNTLKEKIKYIVEEAIADYGNFTSFISRTMQILKGKTKAPISKKQAASLKSSPYFSLFQDLHILEVTSSNLMIDDRYRLLMTNVGSWLESYLYLTLKESGLFDDCVMSAAIDFSAREDVYPVVCEIDMIVALNNRLVFVSCKSNKVDTQALNEIKVHNVMFGNDMSKACIFTADDLNVNNPPIFEKAQELDVAVIDSTAIKNKAISLVMKKILEGTYSYERVVR